MNSTNDISIGKNKWIKWKDFDPVGKNILEIDDLLKPTFEFWDKLETQCMVACCGIDAFALWEEDIIKASNDFNKVKLINEFQQIKIFIINAKEEIVASTRLNNLFDKSVFIELIDHFVKSIKK